MPSPPDPQADIPSKGQEEAQQPDKPPKLDFKRTTDWIGILATVAAALSACFSYLAVDEMKDTNRLMAEQVHTGQQAYVFAVSVPLKSCESELTEPGHLAKTNW